MKRIAVVEDNADNRLLVRVLLEELYELTDYENGAEAWAGLQHSPLPDLVLMDISLPDIEGTALLDRLRAEPRLRDIPVIALTAHAMTGDREKYLGLGFDDYLTKPIVDENTLLHAIARALTEPSKNESGQSRPP